LIGLVLFRMQFLPQPVLKLQKSLQLPNSPLSLRMRYECPLEALDDPFRPPARLMFRHACYKMKEAVHWTAIMCCTAAERCQCW
jgi:hypothetical protein